MERPHAGLEAVLGGCLPGLVFGQLSTMSVDYKILPVYRRITIPEDPTEEQALALVRRMGCKAELVLAPPGARWLEGHLAFYAEFDDEREVADLI